MSYTAKYPATIPEATEIYQKTNFTDWVQAADFDGLRQELHAVMETLGVNPQGEYDDVAARLGEGGGGGYTQETTCTTPYLTKSDFTLDNGNHKMDCSAICPAGTKAIVAEIQLTSITNAAAITIYKENISAEWTARDVIVYAASNTENNKTCILNLDDDLSFSYVSFNGSNINTLDFKLLGFL